MRSLKRGREAKFMKQTQQGQYRNRGKCCDISCPEHKVLNLQSHQRARQKRRLCTNICT